MLGVAGKKLKYIFQLFKRIIRRAYRHPLPSRVILERRKGQVKLRVDQKAVLIDTREPGTLGGIINFDKIGGPNEATVRVYLYSECPGKEKLVEPFEFQVVTVARKDRVPFYPIAVMDEVYAPEGFRVTLEHTTGLETTFYFHLYRY